MTVYMTKVWGFGSPVGPLQFSQEGWRDRAREILRPGDLVVLVGTHGDQTAASDRGMLLGMMEPTTVAVSALDYELARGPADYDESGRYRWPFGLENRRAWRFLGPPTPLTSISERRFNMDSASGIVPLTDAEAARVAELPKEQCELLQPARAVARLFGSSEARRRGAPPPTTVRRGVMHLRRAPAYTYAMAIEGSNRLAVKIGWAFDFRVRQRQFNASALPEIGGLRYVPKLNHLWDSAFDAFCMEQALLRRFDDRRHFANREVLVGIQPSDVEGAWLDYIRGAMRKANMRPTRESMAARSK